MDSNRPNVVKGSEVMLLQAFARLDSIALGIAVGVWCGAGMLLATAVLLLKGGQTIGSTLGILSQYFIGYTVTWRGSLIGLVYGFVVGFCLGWLVAILRNLFVLIYLENIRFKSAMSATSDFIHKE
jgi:hypothetical protein